MTNPGSPETDAGGAGVARVLRFAVSGVVATGVHAGLLMAMVELAAVPPTIANMLAFLCAFITSYVLQYHWTFRSMAAHMSALPKAAIVAGSGLVLNFIIFSVLVDRLNVNYLVAFAVVVITVPAATYLLLDRWAFRAAGR